MFFWAVFMPPLYISRRDDSSCVWGLLFLRHKKHFAYFLFLLTKLEIAFLGLLPVVHAGVVSHPVPMAVVVVVRVST